MAVVSGSVTLSLTISPINTVLKGKNSVTATVSAKSGSIPSGATVTGGSLRFTSVAVYTSNGIYWRVTDRNDSSSVYAQTGKMTYAETAQFERVDFETPFNYSAILDFAVNSTIGLHFYGAGNEQNALNFKNSAVTLVIDYTYEETSQYTPSTGTLNKTEITANGSESIQLTISGNSSLSHKAIWSMGNKSTTQTIAAGTTSTTFTPDLSWNEELPNAVSGECSVTLETYSGNTKIGQNDYTFTIKVPANLVPTVGAPSFAVVNSAISGVYIQGNSSVKVTSGTASGVRGSSIVSYKFSGPDLSASGSSNNATSDVLNSSGTLTYTVTVTDSRGRTASATGTISVYAYVAPALSAYSAIRCNSSGTAAEDGTSIQVTCTCSCSNLGNSRNTVSWKWEYRRSGVTSWTSGYSSLSSGAVSKKDNIATVENEYQVKITATDTVGNEASIILDVSVAGIVMFFKTDGNGVCFGKKSTKSGKTLEVAGDWTMYHGDYVIPAIIVSSSAPTGAANVIWLKPV